MVPALDMSASEEALRDSFLLSNAVPQNPSLNAGKWRILENSVRKLRASFDHVVVIGGPVFCANIERIGASQVAVPCRLYKVVIAERGGEVAMFAVVLPNDRNPTEPVREFAVPVAEVERLTGLEFCRRVLKSASDLSAGFDAALR